MVPLRILVVDDDALSREVLLLLLTREGHAAEAAESGEEAITAIEGGASAPDLVLTDIQMPGISGSPLALRLREVCGGETCLLAMSGSQPQENALQCFDGFLRKPFSMAALAAAIDDHKADTSVGAAQPSGNVLDRTVYRQLATSMSAEKLAQLYALCLSDVKRRVAAMRQAAAEGDDTTYRREAHSIKGGCGLVGAHELQAIAASEENGGIPPANHVATLDEFSLACERLERMLVANKQSHESNEEPARSHA